MTTTKTSLRYGRNYIGLFVSRNIAALPAVIDLLRESPVKAWCYENVGEFVIILVGGTHTESVGDILTRVHSFAHGGSIIGASIASSSIPPTREVSMIRLPLKQLGPAVLQRLLEPAGYFVIHSPVENAFWCLCTSPRDVFVPTPTPASVRVFRLVQSVTTEPETKHKPSAKRDYDPILAQISELRRQTLPAVRELLDNVRRGWLDSNVEFFEGDPLRTIEEEISEHLDRLDMIYDSDESVASSVSRDTARRTEYWISMLGDLKSGLVGHMKCLEPISSELLFSDATQPFALRALGNLLHECVSRLGLSSREQIVPVLGNTVMPYMYESIPGWSLHGRSTTVVVVPEFYAMRLGAWPFATLLLSKFVDHERMDRLVRRVLRDRSVGEIGDVLRSVHPRIDEGLRNDLMWRERVEGPAVYWTSILISDLVACALCGPAFLFALSRFSLGSVDSGRVRASTRDRNRPSLAQRIRVCLAFFSSQGIDVPFASRFYDGVNAGSLNNLIEDILGLLARPYCAHDHRLAVGSVKRKLLDGTVEGTAPVLVLNALWDAVARNSGYLNEISGLASIAQYEPDVN